MSVLQNGDRITCKESKSSKDSPPSPPHPCNAQHPQSTSEVMVFAFQLVIKSRNLFSFSRSAFFEMANDI